MINKNKKYNLRFRTTVQERRDQNYFIILFLHSLCEGISQSNYYNYN